MAFDATPTALPLAQSGKLHALGAGMLKRLAAMPDLPTLDEQGLKGYECYTWNSILAPAGTPKPIVDKLNAAANKALADPQVIDSPEKGRRRSDAGLDAGDDGRLRQGGAGEMGADHQGVGRAGRLTRPSTRP